MTFFYVTITLRNITKSKNDTFDNINKTIEQEKNEHGKYIKYFLLCNKAREKQGHLTVNIRMREWEKLLVHETKHVWKSFHNFVNRTENENQSNNLSKYKL